MEELNAQIHKYEEFVSHKLQPDLATALTERDAVYNQISEYLKLRNTIEVFDQKKLTSLKTQIDLGCNFYVQARVPDTTYIFVSVGHGFHLQMTHPEALGYITRREAQLQRKADQLTETANRIKAQIKTVYLAIAEIMQLQSTG
ncbi:hypothetical protein H4R33_002951 [Dimargaris cristalligena]|uniref:Prefoldin n=1 Tax=Dimargaris cristalligena TaxID=215637 RepID=A0A4P9ZRZ4_9FUNG|nr:hypothetical protein H4R33_002951 [Dimargaris cristalligena]RKP36326.1 Prefoldin [Dimargaris cristalligena]|eukprot:RKP36326.1 Prefoldin [Dimargaris cristalligena]